MQGLQRFSWPRPAAVIHLHFTSRRGNQGIRSEPLTKGHRWLAGAPKPSASRLVQNLSRCTPRTGWGEGGSAEAVDEGSFGRKKSSSQKHSCSYRKLHSCWGFRHLGNRSVMENTPPPRPLHTHTTHPGNGRAIDSLVLKCYMHRESRGCAGEKGKQSQEFHKHTHTSQERKEGIGLSERDVVLVLHYCNLVLQIKEEDFVWASLGGGECRERCEINFPSQNSIIFTCAHSTTPKHQSSQ